MESESEESFSDSDDSFGVENSPYSSRYPSYSRRKSFNRRGRIGNWSEEEDDILSDLVERHGAKKWTAIAEKLPFRRNGKQCRERWFNHLSPDIRDDWWDPEEDKLIIEKHELLGNQWARISKMLRGRPANSIKNHYNSTLRRLVNDAREKVVEGFMKRKKQFNGLYTVKLELPRYKKTGGNRGQKEKTTQTVECKIEVKVTGKKKKGKKRKRKPKLFTALRVIPTRSRAGSERGERGEKKKVNYCDDDKELDAMLMEEVQVEFEKIDAVGHHHENNVVLNLGGDDKVEAEGSFDVDAGSNRTTPPPPPLGDSHVNIMPSSKQFWFPDPVVMQKISFIPPKKRRKLNIDDFIKW